MVSCIVKLIYAQQTYQSVPRDIHRPRMQQHMTVCPKHRDAYGIHWRTGKTKCCVPIEETCDQALFYTSDGRIRLNRRLQQKLRATRQRLTEEIAGWTSFFQKPACLFQLDHVSKTYSCPFISFSGNLCFRSRVQSRQILKCILRH